MSDYNNDSLDITLLRQRVNLLENQLEEIRLQTHVLLDIARALNASLDPKVIAANIISAMVSLISINQASVYLYNDKKKRL
ncbi:hypothetical protein UF75_4898 [Desulfosporosinus sp. I2]|uniref:hypothetical protein n=1 Tax=Desulfosporosinus sp. I2 TaxID=1617025 RepID=UPI00061EB57F|nr:hypothetical protein [Desulfosporosinus sp. I2]KJR44720.1 hypothetical protein UF75_4898 [Desulfosporosinus sp. I2]